jgi:hypothetical protein
LVEELKSRLEICKQNVTASGSMGNGIANNTLTNVWRQQRIGQMMKPNGKSWPSYNRKKTILFGKG